ncbi:MAG: sigma-70 family RNA polymerase sigma factor [Ignavibacteria bacterium]|nr:sigma-70 family RNA polymerase sigma factor [Ignavibacteria bacterium]
MYQTPEERREQSRAEDKDLIRAALDGDQDAYKRLMKKYHSAIYHLIVRMIGYNAESEDLTQEAFIKAFNSLASFNDEFAFSTWLYKIATNNSIDYLRKRKLKTLSIDKPLVTHDGETQMEIPDSSYVPDKHILQSQQTRTIQTAIDDLPDKYRVVIVMRHQQDKSYEEIAEELNLPLGTVKAHIFRARELLYRALRGRVGDY